MKGICSAISSVLNEDTKDWINMWIFILTPMFVLMAFVGLGVFIYSLSQDQNSCWDVKEVHQRAVKMNVCTGEIEPIEGIGSKRNDPSIQ